MKSPSLYVLERSVRVEEWSAHRGVALMHIRFGVTATAYQPTDMQQTLESLAWEVAELFLLDPTLGGKVDDTILDEFRPDDSPFGPETPHPWTSVSLSWRFQFEQQ